MLAGVVFQLVSLTIYSLMGAEFLLRHHKNNPFNHAHAKAMGPTKPVFSSRVKLMLWGLAQMDIYLFTRYASFPFTDHTITMLTMFIQVCLSCRRTRRWLVR